VGTAQRTRGVVWTGPRKASFVVLAMAAPVALTSIAAAPAALASPAPRATTVTASQNWQGHEWGDALADLLSVGQTSDGKSKAYDATKDPGSLYTVGKEIGARDLWGRLDSKGRRITGQGVTVALLDSGVAPVTGLNGAGKIVNGPDLSLENGSTDLVNKDDFGHGTHLAGIIGAKDTTGTVTPSTDPKVQLGVAPDATIMPIKLSTADGATDVSQVIAALDWVVAHKNDDPSKPIRVVNLSYGTDGAQSYQTDPLAAAAENAWKHGIVVVVSAGNEGTSTGRLTNPAIDPYVLAVGAADTKLRTDTKKATAADFSSVGTSDRHVDILAPGTSIASLRDPGSYIDTEHPEGMVLTDSSGRLFRGSGTSQAAAVASGAIALLLQDHPDLTPDQVKGLLMANATKIAGNANAVGAGVIDIDNAVGALDNLSVGKLLGAKVPGLNVVQSFPAANGSGSLEAARGGSYVYDPATDEPLTGEQDVQGMPWNGAAWFKSASNVQSWSGGQWLGTVWSGNGWTTSASVKSWTNATWSGARWSGARWSGARWSGARWSGARWSDAGWEGARWSGARWSGARWSGNGWGQGPNQA
jgi:serine protease AprX